MTVLALLAGAGGLWLTTGGGSRGAVSSASPAHATVASAAGRPNVVLFVADDLDKLLLRYMPWTRKYLARGGASLDRYYVEQSTCCTSRATMLSGQYVHNHGVRGNHAPAGGFLAWKGHGENRALPTWLQGEGYRTALLGKYLNEYPYPARYATKATRKTMRHYVPPGWSAWTSPVNGFPYEQFRYILNDNGAVDGVSHREFLDGLLGHRVVQQVAGRDGMGFREGGKFVYYASYSPHAPYAHPVRYDKRFGDVRYPRTPAFNERDVSDKFGVTAVKASMSPARVRRADEIFRDRIRSVQVLDHTVKRVVETLKRQGALDNTYLMFTSDNGYNLGEHRLFVAKYNQFQETVNVPLLVRGPGIAPGTKVHELAGNIDLAPTIAAMTGTPAPSDVDGRSLLPLLTGRASRLDRNFLLISRGLVPLERRQLSGTDEMPERGVPTAARSRLADFTGVVSRNWKYVRYLNNSHAELYDLRRDPYELRNLLADGPRALRRMTPRQQRVVQVLRSALTRLRTCSADSCGR